MISKEKLQALQEIYSKENLEKGIFTLVKKFYLENSFSKWQDINAQTILRRLSSKKPLNKTEVAEISFSVFSNAEIYHAFEQSLPKSIQLLIKKLLWRQSMNAAEVNELINGNMLIEKNLGFRVHAEIKKEFYFFTVESDYWYHSSNSVSLSLHPEFKKILVDFYPKPPHYYFIALDDIPETRFRFSASHTIMHELPRLISYYLQNGIKYSNNGRPVETTLSKMQKHCMIEEFYNPQHESLDKMRSMLIAGMLHNYKADNINKDNSDVLKDLFTKNYLRLPTSQFILQQLKGWGYLNGSAFLKDAESKIQAVFKELPVDKWVSCINLIELVESRLININPIYSSDASNYLYFNKETEAEYGSYSSKRPLGSNEYNRFITDPFLRGSVFLYAAFGLIDIAYADVNTSEFGKTFYSGFDGLMYFRLTPLGAYVLGLTATYEATGSVQKSILHFTEDSLMILGEGEMGVIDVMLANYAEKIGGNRYRVTNGSFLKDCRTAKDVVNKIALFKKTANTKLPAFWENYFTQLLANTQAIKEKPQTIVFQLPSDAKELHRVTAQDSVLKQLVLKAENYHILVANTDAMKFKNRMKELGYVIE
jgi:hypothetical protein